MLNLPPSHHLLNPFHAECMSVTAFDPDHRSPSSAALNANAWKQISSHLMQTIMIHVLEVEIVCDGSGS